LLTIKKTSMLNKTRMATAFLVFSFVFSCTKTSTESDFVKTEQVSAEKQKTIITFSEQTYPSQSGLISNKLSISGSAVGSYAISTPIELKSFKSEAPFISVYGNVTGKNLEDNHFSIEFAPSANGTDWQNWIAVSPNADAPLSSQLIAFNNVELDKSVRFVKFRITFNNKAAELETGEFYFFNPGVTSPEIQAQIDAAAKEVSAAIAFQNGEVINAPINPALCAKPGFTSRSTWGARAAKSAPSYTTVNFLVVHHEFGSNTSTDWAARVRSVQNFHMDSNGWADIAYNYLVDPNGVAYEGRGGGENVVGAHLCAKNTNTMGVCMLGNFTSVKPTNNAEYTLKRILAWKANQRSLNVLGTGFHVDRTIYKISGHRSSCSTDCPGTSLFNELPRIRNDIKVSFIDKCK
jgi:hypothetical protein